MKTTPLTIAIHTYMYATTCTPCRSPAPPTTTTTNNNNNNTTMLSNTIITPRHFFTVRKFFCITGVPFSHHLCPIATLSCCSNHHDYYQQQQQQQHYTLP